LEAAGSKKASPWKNSALCLGYSEMASQLPAREMRIVEDPGEIQSLRDCDSLLGGLKANVPALLYLLDLFHC
jgi:hypothetical protein